MVVSVNTSVLVEAVTHSPEWEAKLNLFLTDVDYRSSGDSVILTGVEGGTVNSTFRLTSLAPLVELSDLILDPAIRRSTSTTARSRLEAIQNDPLVKAQRFLPKVGSDFAFTAQYAGWTSNGPQVRAPSNSSQRITIVWPTSLPSTEFGDYNYGDNVEVVAEVLTPTTTDPLILRGKSFQKQDNPSTQITPSGRKYPRWNQLSSRWNSMYTSPSAYSNQAIKILCQFQNYLKTGDLITLNVNKLYAGEYYSSHPSHGALQVRFAKTDEMEAFLASIRTGQSLILDIKLLGGSNSAPQVELTSLCATEKPDQTLTPGSMKNLGLAPGALVRTLPYDTRTKSNSYFQVSWSPKGRYVAGATESEVMVWNDSTGELIGSQTATAGKSLAWHPNGSGFATNTSSSTTPILWNPLKMNSPQTLALPNNNNGFGFGFGTGFSMYASYPSVDLSFNSNGTILADSRSYPVFLWDTRNLTTNGGLFDASMGVQICGEMNPQTGKTMEYAGVYNQIGAVVIDFSNRTVPIRRVISYNTWQPAGNVAMLIGRQVILQTPNNLQPNSYMDLTWNSQREELAIITARTVEIWSLKTRENKLERTLQPSNPNSSVSFRTVTISPDGKLVAANSSYGQVYVWDIASGAEIVVINNEATSFYSCSFSPNSKQLAITQRDGVGIYQIVQDN